MVFVECRYTGFGRPPYERVRKTTWSLVVVRARVSADARFTCLLVFLRCKLRTPCYVRCISVPGVIATPDCRGEFTKALSEKTYLGGIYNSNTTVYNINVGGIQGENCSR